MRAMRAADPTPAPVFGYRVPLMEVVGVGADPGFAAQQARVLGLEVAEDWAGRPSLAPADARTLRLHLEAQLAEHEAKWRIVLEKREAQKAARAEQLRAQMAEQRRLMEEQAVRIGEALASGPVREGPRFEPPVVDISMDEAARELAKRRRRAG